MTCTTACLGTGPGPGHGHLTICQPTANLTRRLPCPYHGGKREMATLYDAHSYYAPSITFACKARLGFEDGWTGPVCAVSWCRCRAKWRTPEGDRCGTHARSINRRERVRLDKNAQPTKAQLRRLLHDATRTLDGVTDE